MPHIKKYVVYKIDDSYEFGFGLDSNYHKQIIPRDLFVRYDFLPLTVEGVEVLGG